MSMPGLTNPFEEAVCALNKYESTVEVMQTLHYTGHMSKLVLETKVE